MTDTKDRISCRNASRLAFSLGIVWGGAMFLTGVVATYTTEYAHEMVKVFGSIYYGYDASWPGAALGLLWGFADVFIATWIVVVIYNALGRCGAARTGEEAG